MCLRVKIRAKLKDSMLGKSDMIMEVFTVQLPFEVNPAKKKKQSAMGHFGK